MPSSVDALTVVRDAVAVVCEVDPSGLTAETSFEELGADSLSRVSIADVVEETLARPGFRIDDATLGRMAVLSDLSTYVEQHAPLAASR